MTGAITMRLALIEGAQLARVTQDFLDLLGAGDDPADPAFSRLAPDVYPDDADASAAFAASTRADLLGRRRTDAITVRDALSPLDDEFDELPEEEALAERTIEIGDAELDAWLRTLTAIRLVLASRLEIVDDEDLPEEDDPRYGVYDWLGYRLELLIEAADAASS